jgi:hypothetical protein
MPSRALRVSAYGLPSTVHFCANTRTASWDRNEQTVSTSSSQVRTLCAAQTRARASVLVRLSAIKEGREKRPSYMCKPVCLM